LSRFKVHPAANFKKAADEIFNKISDVIPADFDATVRAIITGDSAAYYHIGGRIPHRLDVEFSHNIILPDDLTVIYKDAGIERELILSRVKISLELIHDDYARYAILVSSHHPHLHIYVLSPIDLAVSKLGRFSDADQSDIKLLAEKGLYKASELEERANEALACYFGDIHRVNQNIRDAVNITKEVN
jgi:hypothetical protein